MEFNVANQNFNKKQHPISLMWRVISFYAFKPKSYPAHLYNIYGSEGHSPDRDYVDKLIKENGFWKASWLVCRKVGETANQ